MQKLINDPARFVDEMLEGLQLAHPGRVMALADEPRAIVRADLPPTARVTIATGGGSGHLPLFVGYVTRGLVDGCAVGNLFASPSADQILAVTRAIHRDRGVLYLYANYGGDRMNFELAAELAGLEGIETLTVLGADDVASAPPERATDRRGIAGIWFGYRVAHACALAGEDLETVARVTSAALGRTRSIGVALSPCTLPTVGHPNFELPAGQTEIGMGIHGEPGVRRGPLQPADAIVDDMVDRVLADLAAPAGAEVGVLVNGLGATPAEELYILYRRVHRRLRDAGLGIRRAWVGEYATSLEMAGASLSVMHIEDDMRRWFDDPAVGSVPDI